uniref:Glucose-methanol-choline oxidoreductase N-terminal domain-containing protein n=1 Tax=Musca domestica TaxID=7370 RepID=A0A1I8MUI4_MUSDO
MLFASGTSACAGHHCSALSVGAVNTLVSLLVEGILTAQCNISNRTLWPEDYAEQALNHGLAGYDFVVIGGGSAGSAVASRLSENSNWSVLLLEAGDDPPQESELPIFSSELLNSKAAYHYTLEANNVSCKAFKNNQCRWSRGNCLGGTGSINGMVYVEGTPENHDLWCSQGSKGWCYDELRQFYTKAKTPQGNSSHPLGYVVLNPANATDMEFVELVTSAWDELRQNRLTQFGDENYLHYNFANVTFANGHRWSTGKSYLGKVRQRPNLKVIKNARVTKLQFDKEHEKLLSVEFVVREKRTMKVQVNKEAILSAGALESPKLLMLSGIGPFSHLRRLNIPLRHNLPVGRNLQDHVVLNLYFKMPPSPSSSGSNDLDGIYEYLMHGTGPLASFATGQLTAYLKTDKNTTTTSKNMHSYLVAMKKGSFQQLELSAQVSGLKDELKNFLRQQLEHHDIFVVYILLAQPKSRGSIKLKTSSSKDPPIIDAGYLTQTEDKLILMSGIEYALNLLETSSFRERQIELLRIPLPECDGYQFKSLEYWHCFMEHFSSTGYHFAGTIKMGAKEDNITCVDPELRVKGVRNLRVADASIMPRVTSHNTNAPTIMIGEKAADMIWKQWA